MRIQKNPESVVITDEKALPVAWKDVILTMPAYVWEGLLQRLDKSERAFFEAHLKKREAELESLRREIETEKSGR